MCLRENIFSDIIRTKLKTNVKIWKQRNRGYLHICYSYLIIPSGNRAHCYSWRGSLHQALLCSVLWEKQTFNISRCLYSFRGHQTFTIKRLCNFCFQAWFSLFLLSKMPLLMLPSKSPACVCLPGKEPLVSQSLLSLMPESKINIIQVSLESLLHTRHLCGLLCPGWPPSRAPAMPSHSSLSQPWGISFW